MNEQETQDKQKIEGKNILLLPCSGVEKLTGQLSSLIVAETMASEKISNLIIQPSFAQLSVKLEDATKIAENAQIIAINGCGSQCVSKLLDQQNLKYQTAINVAQLIKGTGYQPKNPYKLTENELNLIPLAAQKLIEKIQKLSQTKQVFDKTVDGRIGEKEIDFKNFNFDPNYSEYFEYQQAKFVFKVPKNTDNLYFNWNDAWGYLQGEYMIVGISDYLQQNMSDIMMVELPEIGQKVENLEGVASLESTKTVNEIISPCSGEIVFVNDRLNEAPELINEDPYHKGWIFIIKTTKNTNPQDFEEELGDMMNPEDYYEFMKGKVDEETK